ncbi:unnamed protein product [Paramecium pentaurelia]|uniref:Transmembrane protein n=1 Tax=Paramecium pentaurelia TaxID=43138 RepID=A0A8S1X976_9CILI|nr:unnamed protein product [Paramecium pentaurelia]
MQKDQMSNNNIKHIHSIVGGRTIINLMILVMEFGANTFLQVQFSKLDQQECLIVPAFFKTLLLKIQIKKLTFSIMIVLINKLILFKRRFNFQVVIIKCTIINMKLILQCMKLLVFFGLNIGRKSWIFYILRRNFNNKLTIKYLRSFQTLRFNNSYRRRFNFIIQKFIYFIEELQILWIQEIQKFSYFPGKLAILHPTKENLQENYERFDYFKSYSKKCTIQNALAKLIQYKIYQIQKFPNQTLSICFRKFKL